MRAIYNAVCSHLFSGNFRLSQQELNQLKAGLLEFVEHTIFGNARTCIFISFLIERIKIRKDHSFAMFNGRNNRMNDVMIPILKMRNDFPDRCFPFRDWSEPSVIIQIT